jgi:DNA mismatch repair ATPase MutL
LEAIIENYKHFQDPTPSTIGKRMAQSVARSLAVKRGRRLSALEMQRLVDDLMRCTEPALGIDGKPCSWMLTNDEILSKMRR